MPTVLSNNMKSNDEQTLCPWHSIDMTSPPRLKFGVIISGSALYDYLDLGVQYVVIGRHQTSGAGADVRGSSSACRQVGPTMVLTGRMQSTIHVC